MPKMNRATRKGLVSLSIKGQKKMTQNLIKLAEQLGPKSYASAVTNLLLKVQVKAMEYTPVDTGYLKASARSKLVTSTDKGAAGVVYYFAPYATIVHDKSSRPGFLRDAVVEESMVMAEELGLSLNKTMFSKDMA